MSSQRFKVFAFFITLLAALLFLALAIFMPAQSKLYLVLMCAAGFACILSCYSPRARMGMWDEMQREEEGREEKH